MATNADNFSVGPDTPEIIGLPSRFVDFPEGVKYWNSEAGLVFDKAIFQSFR